jgi:hypothetical protein
MGERAAPARRAAGLVVFTEGATVPRAITAARAAMVLGLAAAVPLVLLVDDGRRLFWAGAVAALPLLWLVGGYHLWRRICPLAVVGQLGRLVGRPGTRRIGGWFAEHALVVQLAIMVAALSARLIVANGSPAGLVALLAVVAGAAALTSLVFTGKTWCNFLCPIGVVERIYAEPIVTRGPEASGCAPCTACKKACPDLDLEQGYWKDLGSRARWLAFAAWPGVVLGFYLAYRVRAGDWAFYFSGAWTREADQAAGWLGPGVAAAPAIPQVVAAPLVLLACGGASAVVVALGERAARARLARRDPAAAPEAIAALVRHRALALCGYAAFLGFYAFAGQPLLRTAPPIVAALVGIATVAVATAVLLRRWPRREVDFLEEKVAAKLLKRWEWGAAPRGELREVVLIHAERSKAHDERLAAYRAAVRELVADGIASRAELAMLAGLRARLGVTDREHDRIVAELAEDERRLFDSVARGERERAVAHERYRQELGRAALVAARAGRIATVDELAPIAREHAIDAAAHAAAVAALGAEGGPLAAVAAAEVAAAAALRDVARGLRAAGPRSASHGLAAHLATARADERLDRADELAPALDAGARAALARARADALAERAAPTDLAAALAPLAGDDAPAVRAVALHLAARAADPAAATRIAAGLDDADPLVREAAVHALRARGPLPAALAVRALGDPDPAVRRAAGDGGLAAASLDPTARIDQLTTLERMMVIHGVPLFADLAGDDLEDVARAADERRLGEGEALCRQGEPGRDVFVLLAGRAEATVDHGGGARVVGAIGPGEILGELAVLDPAPRTATVVAREPLRCLVLGGERFVALLGERPALGRRVAALLARRLRDALGAGSPPPPAALP